MRNWFCLACIPKSSKKHNEKVVLEKYLNTLRRIICKKTLSSIFSPSSYETGNEINAEESGYVKNFGQGEGKEIQTAEGKFSYKAPDGSLIALTYIADENGFQPQVTTIMLILSYREIDRLSFPPFKSDKARDIKQT